MGANLIPNLKDFSIQTRSFPADTDAMVDGRIQPGPHRLLRFDALVHNAGNADVHLGSPQDNPDLYVWSQAHGHHHLKEFNEYHLLDSADREVVPGGRQPFCLADSERTDPNAPNAERRYHCDDQGLSAGWSAVDDHGLDGQVLIIDGVPDGQYRLLATTNALRVAREDRFLDNSVLVGLHIQGDTITETPPSWGSWESLGAGFTSSLSAVSWGPNRLDLFAVNDDNAVLHTWWDGAAWSQWESLGGEGVWGRTAVTWGPDRLDVFAVADDKAVVHTWWDGAAWSQWESLGGSCHQPLAVVARAPDGLDVISVDQDHVLWHKWWDGSAWQDWESLGGLTGYPPVAVSWGPDRLDVFAASGAVGIYHKWWDGDAWSGPAGEDWTGWELLGEVSIGEPYAVTWGPDRLDLFAAAFASLTLSHSWWDGSTWHAWESQGDWDFWSSDPAVASAVNRLHLFHSQDGTVYHRRLG